MAAQDSFASDSSLTTDGGVADNRRYPQRPVLGVGGIVIQDGKVLLVQRGREPLKGYWSVPGGAVETGERLEEALLREVREETGLRVKPLFLGAVFERLMPDAAARTEFHYVLVDYVCEIEGDVDAAAEPEPGDDAAALGWFQLDEIETMQMTPGTAEVISHALVAYDCWRATGDQPTNGLYLRLDGAATLSVTADRASRRGES
jgi:8-oxo-dGTP diphosphatase